MRDAFLAVVLAALVSRTGADAHAEDKKPAPWNPAADVTAKAPSDWIVKQAKRGAALFSDRDYAFTALPEEVEGGTMVVRDNGTCGDWLAPLTVSARQDCKAYAVVQWKYRGQDLLPESTLVKFGREGWKEVEGEVGTTFPSGEDWRWKVYAKDVKEGEVILQLRTIAWNRVPVVFVFKGATPARPDKPARDPAAPPSKTPLAVELTPKAPTDWLLKEAKRGATAFGDKPYLFHTLPAEVAGGTLLSRGGEESRAWLTPGTVSVAADGTVYALVRWMVRGEESVTEVTFAKLAREGWEEVKGDVETTFPNGEDWRWKALAKGVKRGDTAVQLKNVAWHGATVLFVFKSRP